MVRDGGDGDPPRSVLTKVDAVIIFIVIIRVFFLLLLLLLLLLCCVLVSERVPALLSCVERGGSSRHRRVKVAAGRSIYDLTAGPQRWGNPLGALALQLLMEISWMAL